MLVISALEEGGNPIRSTAGTITSPKTSACHFALVLMAFFPLARLRYSDYMDGQIARPSLLSEKPKIWLTIHHLCAVCQVLSFRIPPAV